jgi:hypothetical protein
MSQPHPHLIDPIKDELFHTLQQNGLLISSIPQKYRSDRNLLAAALSQNGLALQLLAKPLQKDLEVVKCAV